jgi:hypothetical protein
VRVHCGCRRCSHEDADRAAALRHLHPLAFYDGPLYAFFGRGSLQIIADVEPVDSDVMWLSAKVWDAILR